LAKYRIKEKKLNAAIAVKKIQTELIDGKLYIKDQKI
jgi:hypothetical protein